MTKKEDLNIWDIITIDLDWASEEWEVITHHEARLITKEVESIDRLLWVSWVSIEKWLISRQQETNEMFEFINDYVDHIHDTNSDNPDLLTSEQIQDFYSSFDNHKDCMDYCKKQLEEQDFISLQR